VFDLAGRMADLEHRGHDRASIAAALDRIDLFVANATAAASFLECSPGDAVAELRDRGVDRAAITRGSRGATLLASGEDYRAPALDVDVADTTGAGDAFTAGLIHAWLLEDRPAPEAGRFAAAAAAHSCTTVGARDGLPTGEAVRRRLRAAGWLSE